ncbi:MAG: hypothetical protein ACQESK_10125 [Bacteroidota bacterium]
MFNKVINTPGFWKSVFGLALAFILVYNLVDIFMKFDFSFADYAEYRFAPDNLTRFFIANIGSGIVYGFVVTFFKFRSKIKKNGD